jgi:transposase
LGLRGFNEDDLYKNLDWCSQNHEPIENHIFSIKEKPSEFILYNVTSSYFEGTKNDSAAYGYNRDRKNDKIQVVAVLLCDSKGDPVAIELFPGNTSDQETVPSQVVKLNSRYCMHGANRSANPQSERADISERPVFLKERKPLLIEAWNDYQE